MHDYRDLILSALATAAEQVRTEIDRRLIAGEIDADEAERMVAEHERIMRLVRRRAKELTMPYLLRRGLEK